MTIMLNLRKKSCQGQHTLERAMFLISIFHKLCKISVEILQIMLIVLAPSHKKYKTTASIPVKRLKVLF